MGIKFKRREVLKIGIATLLAGSAGVMYEPDLFKQKKNRKSVKVNLNNNENKLEIHSLLPDLDVRDNLQKAQFFNKSFSDDILLNKKKIKIFNQTLQRIVRVQKVIGYANFNLLGFDDMLVYARRYSEIGAFTKAELKFVEEIFSYDAHNYGFNGAKVIPKLTSNINKKETVKISGSGHYLFQGEALDKFKLLKKDVGSELILTSGVRSVVKQLHLFLAKLKNSKGNLSMASRSLAPPGHSYHGIGDFDVGKKGFGYLNFSAEFAKTREYKKLITLKYIDLRYTKNNQVGVRYEPWHIKVV